ncbi:MAG: 50S ribosomal protein L31 [Chloroflexi bacterium]|nr:50S ribosomal protein L31 [Chloroflexota bacterium]MBP8054253.1 50S ribosomal protein L31 [Chloroflexota bacterium]
MKSGIHPQWYPEAKVICNGSVVMTTGATKPEIHVEIWSGNHPFFTGQTRLLDTEGQVDRFMRRLQVREQIRTTQEEQKEAVDPTRWTVDMMSVGTRAENALREAGLTTVSDVANKLQTDGEDALLALPGIGQKALIDIKRFLRAEGLLS